MEIYLARDQGFCTGVASAVRIVEETLQRYGTPLYIYHEIVHNTFIVENFKRQGICFVDGIEDIPAGRRVIFSAHGVPPSIMDKAVSRGLKCIDATCPLVKRIHTKAKNYSENHYHVILLGHRGHQEIIGTSGYVKPELLHIVENKGDVDRLSLAPNSRVAYLTQTTFSVDETKDMIAKLKVLFPKISGPIHSDICYATQKHQDAIKELAKFVSTIIVCGSPASSNSNRLRETGERAGIKSYIIDRAKDLKKTMIENENKIGISSGASVPKVILQEVVGMIQSWVPDSKIYCFEPSNPDPIFRKSWPN